MYILFAVLPPIRLLIIYAALLCLFGQGSIALIKTSSHIWYNVHGAFFQGDY